MTVVYLICLVSSALINPFSVIVFKLRKKGCERVKLEDLRGHTGISGYTRSIADIFSTLKDMFGKVYIFLELKTQSALGVQR